MKQNNILRTRKTILENLIKGIGKQITNYYKILAMNEKLYKQNKAFIDTYAEETKINLMQGNNGKNYNTTKTDIEKKIKDLRAYKNFLKLTGNNERNN